MKFHEEILCQLNGINDLESDSRLVNLRERVDELRSRLESTESNSGNFILQLREVLEYVLGKEVELELGIKQQQPVDIITINNYIVS